MPYFKIFISDTTTLTIMEYHGKTEYLLLILSKILTKVDKYSTPVIGDYINRPPNWLGGIDTCIQFC